MKYPVECDTDLKKYEYTCKAQAELHKLHNQFAKWLNEGLNVEEYNKIHSGISKKYPYKKKISKAEWDAFYADWRKRFNVVALELSAQRARNEDNHAKSDKWSVDLSAIDTNEVKDGS